jgi:hypothetical protein
MANGNGTWKSAQVTKLLGAFEGGPIALRHKVGDEIVRACNCARPGDAKLLLGSFLSITGPPIRRLAFPGTEPRR